MREIGRCYFLSVYFKFEGIDRLFTSHETFRSQGVLKSYHVTAKAFTVRDTSHPVALGLDVKNLKHKT